MLAIDRREPGEAVVSTSASTNSESSAQRLLNNERRSFLMLSRGRVQWLRW